jgi:hypothetical protein
MFKDTFECSKIMFVKIVYFLTIILTQPFSQVLYKTLRFDDEKRSVLTSTQIVMVP